MTIFLSDLMVEVTLTGVKSNFYYKRTQEDGHYRENPLNHEILTVREVDCHMLKKNIGASSHSNT